MFCLFKVKKSSPKSTSDTSRANLVSTATGEQDSEAKSSSRESEDNISTSSTEKSLLDRQNTDNGMEQDTPRYHVYCSGLRCDVSKSKSII